MEKVAPFLQLDWDLLFSLITFLVLFLILKHFFFEKVHAFMEKRSQEIRDQLDHAEETDRTAENKLAAYEEKIADVETESRRIIKKARDEAGIQSQEIIDQANENARQMIERSEEQIRRDKFSARKQLKEEVGTLASMAAGKILEKEIKPEEHQELINKVIEEAEDESWN